MNHCTEIRAFAYPIDREIDPLTTERINLARPLPVEFHDWPIACLDDMEATYLVALATAREADDASSIAYVENQLRKLDAERDRQARFIRVEAERRGRSAPKTRHDGPQLADLAVQLKERVDLIEFVAATSATVIAERSGDRVKARCPNPLHPDRTPSCVIDRRRFHCFACGADGDVYDLVGLVWGVSLFRDRVRIVAEFAREVVPS